MKITTKINLPVITNNLPELRKRIEESLQEYEGLMFTDENIGEAKKIRADLNVRLKDEIDNERKRIKKEVEAPIKAFEKEVKEIVRLIEDKIAPIDIQIKDYEERQRQEKEKTVRALWKQEIPIEPFFKREWLNASYSTTKIVKDIQEIEQRIETELLAIGGFTNATKYQNIYREIGDFEKVKELAQFEDCQETETNQNELKITNPFDGFDETPEVSYLIWVGVDKEQKFLEFCKQNQITFRKTIEF